MNRLRLIILAVMMLMIASFSKTDPARALNAAIPIKPGQPVTGEITQAVQEIRYTFDGKQHTYVRIANVLLGDTNKLKRIVKLLGPDGQQVEAGFMNSYRPEALKDFLPADGTYTIDVGPDPNGSHSPEESVGQFKLRLDVSSALDVGKSVTATAIVYDDTMSYAPAYVVTATSDLRVHVTSAAPAADKTVALSVYVSQEDLQAPPGFPRWPLDLSRLDIAQDWPGDVTATLPTSQAVYLIHVDPNNSFIMAGQQSTRDFTLVVDKVNK